MLQFITKKSDRYTIEEEVQMVIEGGCGWIEVDPESIENKSDLREKMTEIVSLCRESETILTLRHDVETANEMKIHGVQLGKKDISPAEAREVLGPHAIIGVDVECAEDILKLKGLDIDYVTLGPYGKLGFEDYRNIVAEVRSQEILFPIVACGDIKKEDLLILLGAGVNGVAISDAIISAENPVTETHSILEILTK